MKKVACIAASVPGMSLAHGMHAPVDDAVHGSAHLGVWAGVALVIVVGVVAWTIRVRS